MKKTTHSPALKRWIKVLYVALPVLVLMLAAVVVSLFGGRSSVMSSPEEIGAVLSPSPSAAPASPTPTPTPTAAPTAEKTALLQLSPDGETLTVLVCDPQGVPLSGTAFQLKITNPSGGEQCVFTDKSGSYTARDLTGGDYTVTLLETPGYTVPAAAVCTVQGRLEYVPIENIYEQVEVAAVAELREEETKPAHARESAPPAEVEELSSQETVASATGQPGVGTVVVGQSPGTQPESGEVFYSYDYETGPNGFLLLTDGTESAVLPVEENGVLAYGLERVTDYWSAAGEHLTAIPEGAVEGTDYFAEEYTRKETLILAPGVPTEGYAITARESERQTASAAAGVRAGWISENDRTYYYDANGRPVTGLKRIDGALHFFDGTGAEAARLGIDVSYFNGDINWYSVKADGVDFAIVRVAGRTWGQGVLFEDENAYTQGADGGYYLQEAKAAGLQVGAYVYSNAVSANEAVEEASLAVEIVGKAGVALDYPIYLDLEYSGEYPEGRADKLTPAERAEIVRAFCATVEAAGYQAGVYVGGNFLNSAVNLSDLSGYSLWYANYTEGYRLPSFRGFDIWQFTASAVVRGATEYSDLNAIF